MSALQKRLELLPAVDVRDGQAVRLVHGESGSETSYGSPLEAALAWQRAGAEWLHTEVDKGLYYSYLNLGPVTSTSPVDGREMYYNAKGRDPLCYAGGNDSSPSSCGRLTKSLNNPNFANVTAVTRTSKGGGNAITLQLSQQVAKGFSWNAGYTRTSATEVSPLTSSTANLAAGL